MGKKIRKYAGVIYVALMALVVLIVLRCTDELGQVYSAMRLLDGRWLGLAGGCIALYLFLRVATLRYYLRRHGQKISWRVAVGATGVGQFYSAITPSSSGGQPMQVFWLKKRGVPVSLGTSCISAKFLGFQSAFLIIGGVLWLSNWRMVSEQLYGFRWLVMLGYLVNLGLIVAVMLTIPRSGAVERLSRWIIGLGTKLKIVKHPEETYVRFRDLIADYREALQSLLRHPLDAVVIFLLSVLQVLAYMSVVLCLYRAFGLTETPGTQILTLQVLLFIAAAFVPLPGAAGAQESGFCVFFRNVFPQDSLVAAMLCWRFFSYYALMFLGLMMMLAAGMAKPPKDEEERKESFSKKLSEKEN